jgi:outer membrane protein
LTISDRLARARGHLLNSVNDLFASRSDQAALARAMLLGDRSFVDHDRVAQFQETGVYHVLVLAGLHVGAQLAYESGRESSESDFLNNHHVSDIDPGASIGVHLEWDFKIGPMPITLLARARQNLNFDRGAQVDFRLSFGIFQMGPFSAGIFAQTIWADSKSTSVFYGVTPEQSAATGLPASDTGNGLLSGSLGLLWSFDLTRNWVVVGNLEVRTLYGDAARSPITECSTNYFITVGLAYRF